MKKVILIASLAIIFIQSLKAQTATNFNCNDCLGNNHDLFSELNSGKVVVIAFVMPCSSCIGPSVSAYTESQNYSTSNPGQVLFYVADDIGNTSCASLTTWCNTNGLGNATKFSNTAVVETPYGSGGMPKIIVIGGSNHTVFYNQNGVLDVASFNTAINNALAAAAVGVKEYSIDNFQLSLFPNPVTDKKPLLSYQLKRSEEVSIDIYNTIGALVKNVLKEEQSAGNHEQQINPTALSTGTYFIKLKVGDKTDFIKFIISE